MSDGGWQPPEPGDAAPSPPAAGDLPPPTIEQPTIEQPTTEYPTAAAAPSGRSRGKVIAAAVGAVAIIGAGVFAITRISGDSGSGGASSPEAAANDFLDALDQEDVLGLVDVLLPGERDTFRQPMQDLVSELTRLEVLDDEADLSSVAGVDLQVTDRHVEQHDTNVDDIVNVEITAKIGGSLKGEQLPIGDWVRDAIGDKDLSELDDTADPEEDSFPITAVRHDGRWYLSAFYSIAENARHEDGDPAIPDRGVPLAGGDSPEAAMDNLLRGAAELDLASVIGSLNPNEFESLQRYAPLFIADAQDELDQADAKITLGDTGYDVSGTGDTRHVNITAFSMDVTAEDQTANVRLEDGCLVVDNAEAGAEDYDSCKNGGYLTQIPDLETTGVDEQQIRDLQDTLRRIFADYENPGFTVKRVDGKWYVSPMATGFDQLLAVSTVLTRDEIEDVIDQVRDIVDTVEENGGFDESLPAVPDYSRPDSSTPTTEGSLSTIPEGTAPSDTGPSTTEASSAADACYAEDDPQSAANCFTGLVGSGEIEASEVPWYLRGIECGAADAYWSGDYYSLADAEFVALVNQVAPCFQALVASGEMSEFDLPPEIAHPECLKDRNPYAPDAEDQVLDDFLDCAYG